MLTGVFQARKKDGSIYYRANITYRSKHISLGSFPLETAAHQAYLEADCLLQDDSIRIDQIQFSDYLLKHKKPHLYVPFLFSLLFNTGRDL